MPRLTDRPKYVNDTKRSAVKLIYCKVWGLKINICKFQSLYLFSGTRCNRWPVVEWNSNRAMSVCSFSPLVRPAGSIPACGIFCPFYLSTGTNCISLLVTGCTHDSKRGSVTHIGYPPPPPNRQML